MLSFLKGKEWTKETHGTSGTGTLHIDGRYADLDTLILRTLWNDFGKHKDGFCGLLKHLLTLLHIFWTGTTQLQCEGRQRVWQDDLEKLSEVHNEAVNIVGSVVEGWEGSKGKLSRSRFRLLKEEGRKLNESIWISAVGLPFHPLPRYSGLPITLSKSFFTLSILLIIERVNRLYHYLMRCTLSSQNNSGLSESPWRQRWLGVTNM